ncbi:MAG TPA: histidine phosphatase family protein [Phycicoccus sp.]|nr:histidine phosphatase family protein [Phycicoccus sp.]
MTIVYWVRHGENVANVSRTLSHRVFDGDLTAVGRSQAQALAARLAGEGFDFGSAWVSPLRRARQTAQILTAELGLGDAEVVEALREVDVGVLDGRSDDEAWRVYETTLTRWRSGDLGARFPGGEDGQQLADRLAGALTTIARRDRGPALVVGHGANLRAALPVLAGGADPGRDLGTGYAARLAVIVGRHPLVTVLDWP